MKKTLITLSFTSFIFIMTATVACAHVVVKPNSVPVASYQTFSVGVPVESASPTTSLRLLIPEGITNVTPNVKPGWKISEKKDSTNSTLITEITWEGGSIPAGQRDEFLFSAKTPAAPTALAWKAYVRSANGKVTAWDATPGEAMHADMDNEEMENGGPYSVTQVNLKATPPAATSDIPTPDVTQSKPDQKKEKLLFIMGVVSMAFSIIAIELALHQRHSR